MKLPGSKGSQEIFEQFQKLLEGKFILRRRNILTKKNKWDIWLLTLEAFIRNSPWPILSGPWAQCREMVVNLGTQHGCAVGCPQICTTAGEKALFSPALWETSVTVITTPRNYQGLSTNSGTPSLGSGLCFHCRAAAADRFCKNSLHPWGPWWEIDDLWNKEKEA